MTLVPASFRSDAGHAEGTDDYPTMTKSLAAMFVGWWDPVS